MASSARGEILIFALYHRINSYPGLIRKILESHGWRVTLQHLPDPGPIQRGRYEACLVNWLEDYPLRPQGFSGLLLFPVWALQLARYVIRLKRTGTPIVLVRHNEVMHQARGLRRTASALLIRLLERLCDRAIVHTPAAAEYGPKYCYVPHPLYPPSDGLVPSPFQLPPRIACFGRIDPSKDLETLVLEWPEAQPLTIAGPVNDTAYLQRLRHLAAGKAIELRPDYLPPHKLDQLLLDTEIVVLPRSGDRAIVSGTFFHAISRGCFVVARRSRYLDLLKPAFPHIRLFHDAVSLRAALEGAAAEIGAGLTRDTVVAAATAISSDRRISSSLVEVVMKATVVGP